MNDINTLFAVILPTLKDDDKSKVKDALVAHICKNIETLRINDLFNGAALLETVKPLIEKEISDKVSKVISQKGFLEKEIKEGIEKHIEAEFEWHTDNGNMILNIENLQEAMTNLITNKLKQ